MADIPGFRTFGFAGQPLAELRRAVCEVSALKQLGRSS
jgi:hypothetical protein